jgi:hypothetical protein
MNLKESVSLFVSEFPDRNMGIIYDNNSAFVYDYEYKDVMIFQQEDDRVRQTFLNHTEVETLKKLI